MPTHKGIKLSIVSQYELKIHPEFPHPDSSQFTYRSPGVNRDSTFMGYTPPSASSESKADRLLGRQTAVSVYIPSLSGSRFWIRYGIGKAAAATSQWFYFKLLMNGRHIASCGTNSRTKPSGQIMRALFEPSDRWNYKENGTVYKNNGTEVRPFFFGTESDGCSAANDGGLIEVQVFRARGRKRRFAVPEEFKNHDKYGIVMPSGGLLDKPQDAKFYDWHLKDSKTDPFASFKFHYRSWDSLVSQQLIPADHPRTLMSASPSLLAMNSRSQELSKPLEDDNTSAETESQTPELKTEIRDSGSSQESNDPWLTTVFDKSPECPEDAAKLEKRTAFIVPPVIALHLSDPSQFDVPISRFSDAIDQSMSQQQDILNRPLPEMPTRQSSIRHKRNASAASHAPSISPSLRSYVERESASPDPIIGIAAVVALPHSKSSYSLKEHPDSVTSAGLLSTVPFNLSPPSALASKRRGMTSPPIGRLFHLPNITIRKHRPSPAKQLPRLITSPPENDREDRSADDHELSGNMTTLSLSESEWMCSTPSPVRNDPEQVHVEKMWSPRIDANSPSKDGAALRKKAMDWYDDVRYSEEPDNSPQSPRSDEGPKIRAGNWI